MISGIAMLVIGVLRNQPAARRVIRVILGPGFIGYGCVSRSAVGAP